MSIKYIHVTPENIEHHGVFCIKNKKAPGYKAKLQWFKKPENEELKIIIAQEETGKQIGFIEYLPSESAWRPISADNYLFIHCIALFSKNQRGKGIAGNLLRLCEEDARKQQKAGICTMSSAGAWMASKNIFSKNGFSVCDQLDRFELMYKRFDPEAKKPGFNHWTENCKKYQGWHIVYSDQCPWHEKSVTDLYNHALDEGIELKITKIESPREAQQAPSGFGTFSLIHNGELLADHYISKTRFKNILKSELKS